MRTLWQMFHSPGRLPWTRTVFYSDAQVDKEESDHLFRIARRQAA